jgi:DNA-binding response OmpR family regulator
VTLPEPAGGADNRPPPRVLLVGRYRPLLKVLTQGLEEEGFDVVVAPETEDGASAAGVAAYQAVVLDLLGPADRGLSLLEGWRRARRRTPVLVLGPPAGLDAGADDWLAKPFALEELFARLRALVRPAP